VRDEGLMPVGMLGAVISGMRSKLAEAMMLADTGPVHVPVPEHAFPQPVNVEPEAGVAVRVTDVPEVMETEHVEPQFTPPVLEVIVPLPAPLFVTERVKIGAVLDTVTVTLDDVLVFPAASLATAVSVWLALVTPMVFHVPEYGEVVNSEPRLAPSSLNWTPATPTLSEAVADMVTELETVEPLVGRVMETVGAVMSAEAVVVTGRADDGDDVLPAASYAATVYE
jgi:hypothetical protein